MIFSQGNQRWLAEGLEQKIGIKSKVKKRIDSRGARIHVDVGMSRTLCLTVTLRWTLHQPTNTSQLPPPFSAEISVKTNWHRSSLTESKLIQNDVDKELFKVVLHVESSIGDGRLQEQQQPAEWTMEVLVEFCDRICDWCNYDFRYDINSWWHEYSERV